MKKAILIFDVPKSCVDCPNGRITELGNFCSELGEYVEYGEKSENCKLIEIPKRKQSLFWKKMKRYVRWCDKKYEYINKTSYEEFLKETKKSKEKKHV